MNLLHLLGLFLYLTLFPVTLIQAQNLIAAAGQCQARFKQHFENKGDPNFVIGVSPASTTVVGWGFSTSSNCPTASFGTASDGDTVPLGNNLEANFGSNTVTINNNGSEPISGEVDFILQARIGGGTTIISKSYRFIIREPLAMVFVVDRSGSMECGPDRPLGLSGWDACTSDTDDKWRMLSDAFDLFLDTLTLQTTPTTLDQDNFSVVYFDGAVQPSTIVSDAAGARFLSREDFTTSTAASPNTIVDDVDAQIAGGTLGRNGTSIGGGLENAILQKMNNVSGKRQIIVLVTDGQQNATPLLDGAGDHINNATNTSTRTDGDSEPIEVFCLALDGNSNPASYGSLLTNLVNGGNRLFIANDPIPGNNTQHYEQLMEEIFKDHSPQTIGTIRKTVVNGEFEQSFEVNGNGSSLHFNMSFDGARAGAYRFTLEKDGVDVSEMANFQFASLSASATVDFLRHPILNSRGTWRIKGQRSIQVDFQAAQITNPRVQVSAVIEEQEVEVDYSLGAQRLRVGDQLNPSVRLAVRGVPIEGATVTAELVKAGADKGDLVARAEDIPFEPEPGSEVNNPFSVKYGHLRLNNPEYLAPLALNRTLITLEDRGDGLYSGTFLPADVADNYTVIFKVEAQDSTLGVINRHKRVTTAVRFGTLNHNLGAQSIISSGGADGFVHTLTYVPTYEVNGNSQLVGPGYEHLFDLDAPEGTSLTKVTDNGDGSYTLNVFSNRRNPKTTFHLLDEPFYVDRGIQGFDDPYLPYKTHLSVHGGLTQPLDTLDATYDGDFYLELDLGFYLAPRLELELIGGYYSFQPDFSVIGGSANLRYNLLQLGAANATGLTASAGIGFYGPKNEDATFGINGRLGIQRQINSKLSLSLEGAYFLLPDPDYRWATVGLAIRKGL